MANGSSLRATQPPSNPLHSAARYNPESVSGFSIADASEPWLWIVRARSMSALQKYKVKKIDPFSVTVTNSFLRERVGNKKTPTPTPTKKYENSSSNQ
jgi:hypothetical protein